IFPYTAAARGGISGDANIGTADIPNFAVNLPAAAGPGSGGALGFIFGSAGGAEALNLRLSALENTGSVQTISAPKVTTPDHNTEADARQELLIFITPRIINRQTIAQTL